MKEPTRWKVEELNCCFDADMIASPKGEYVLHSDYKQLQAEVERLTENTDKLCKHGDLEIERLKAEVEHLNELANDPYRLSKGWRPIETAPMDGTDILCFCVEPEFEGEENPHTEQRVCFFGQMQEDYSCWMSHYGYEQRPTHWMPLPKPPSV